MKILIRNASIVDGTANTPFEGDILINSDIIEKVAAHIDEKIDISSGDIIIDAKGLYVAPGFIDMHTHTDWANFIPNGLKPKIMQGITTEVVGQCGFSLAPMPTAKQKKWRAGLVIGDSPTPEWRWQGMDEYLSELTKNGLESNLVPFVGHNALRFAIAEDAARPLTRDEIVLLEKLLEASFDSGVFGASFGLIYIPAIFATPEELSVIAKVVAKRNGMVAVHMRSESDELIEALQEMVELTSKVRCKLHISHLKAIGSRNWHKISDVLRIIESKGLTFDHYPYTAGSTSLLSIFPPFMLGGYSTTEQAIQSFSKPANRLRLKNIFLGTEPLPKGAPWDNLPNLLGWENIIIVSTEKPENQKYIGKNILEIAREESKDPTDVAIDLIVAEHGKVRMIDYHSSEESIIEKLRHKSGMIGTDTLYGGKPHPRVSGTYPRLFKQYVFDKQVISIEELVEQMTARPAKTLGLPNRGLILPGYKADLVFFDRTFADCSTYQNPIADPIGLRNVMINGKFKVKDGEYMSEIRSGEVIRKQ